MSGPLGSEPTRPWSPEPTGGPGDEAQTRPAETPWWQKVRRHQPPAPDYPAQPYQAPPAPQPYPQYVQRPPMPPPSAAQPRKPPNGWPLIIALLVGVLLALVVVVVAVLVLAGTANRKELNVAKAEAGVRQILFDSTLGYGVGGVTEVKCNGGDNPVVKKGETFSCDVTVDGAKRRVAVLFIDDNGTYEVDRPR
ncbi:MAG: DUF4333 domain-containing protein [Candidatus Sericytochromatia bacterium]